MGEYTDYEHFTDYPIFDADQHLAEPDDCYTQHIESKYRDRTIQLLERDGKRWLAVDGRLHAKEVQGNRMARPGSLREFLKAMKQGVSDSDAYQWMAPDPAFFDARQRLAMMDRQHVEACILYSNGNGLLAENWIDDEDLYYASSWSYLRWVAAEWGFSTANRMFVAPVFSFRNPRRTLEQLDWFYEHGGKIVCLVTGPAYGRSPADPHYDAIWDRINGANGLVAYHINESIPGYKRSRSAAWGEPLDPGFYDQSAWQWFWAYGDVPAQETFASLVYGNLFGRFPNLKVLSAEHGAEWIPLFLRKLDKMRGMGRGGPWIGGQLTERPSHTFRRHFKVVPYWEDDLTEVVSRVGHEVLLGGSDFPHPEGLAAPTRLVEHLHMLDDSHQRAVMRDHGMALFS